MHNKMGLELLRPSRKKADDEATLIEPSSNGEVNIRGVTLIYLQHSPMIKSVTFVPDADYRQPV